MLFSQHEQKVRHFPMGRLSHDQTQHEFKFSLSYIEENKKNLSIFPYNYFQGIGLSVGQKKYI